MTPMHPEAVRYIHIPPTNITFKFLLEDGQWVCRTTEKYLTDAEQRLHTQRDDLK